MENQASISLANYMELFWEKVEGSNELKRREGHCCCTVGTNIYIFGGVCHGQDGELEEINELLVFDPKSKKCEKVEATGEVPMGRCFSAMASVDDSLYLFGGLNNSRGWMNDLHRLNTRTNTWKRMNANGCVPSPRDKITCAVIEKKIYVFGGFGPYNEKQTLETMEENKGEKVEEMEEEDEEEEESAKLGWFNDMFIYDVVLNNWSEATKSNNDPSKRAAACMVGFSLGDSPTTIGVNSVSNGGISTLNMGNGDAPISPNQLEGGDDKEKSKNVLFGGSKLLVFGGRDKKERLNDLHVFDADSNKWLSDLKVDGNFPGCRSFHSCVMVGKRMVVCGGRDPSNHHYSDTHVLDLETMQWIQPTMKKSYIGRAQMVVGVVAGWVVMFGGSSHYDSTIQQCTRLYNDFYILNADDVAKGRMIRETATIEP